MMGRPIHLNEELICNALGELADATYQRRVWIEGGAGERASMEEVVAALFHDSGLDAALDNNAVCFTETVDEELRSLRSLLRSRLAAEKVGGTAKAIASAEWEVVREESARLLRVVAAYDREESSPMNDY